MNTDKIAVRIATVFGAGYVPGAPGTVGSIIGLMLYVLASTAGGESAVATGLAWLIVFAVWSSGQAARKLGEKDPACIVVDEVVGMWVALLGTHSHGPMLLA
ncbi:MAG: phosphatidylglycerophosphatase A, partial [Candidatus Omnitrophica bacterium]|nr:phosphatidylglycerophosphatase A [Candidatus Omnitrophota bacterium]